MFAYIDDIVIYSSSFEQHVKDMLTIFEVAKKANLSLKPSKCDLMQNRMEFLGHTLSDKGLETQSEKTLVIKIFLFLLQ